MLTTKRLLGILLTVLLAFSAVTVVSASSGETDGVYTVAIENTVTGEVQSSTAEAEDMYDTVSAYFDGITGGTYNIVVYYFNANVGHSSTCASSQWTSEAAKGETDNIKVDYYLVTEEIGVEVTAVNYDENILIDIFDANTNEALLSNNESIVFITSHNYADGANKTAYAYKDSRLYAYEDGDNTLIVSDGEAYGCEGVGDFFTYLFVGDTYSSFLKNYIFLADIYYNDDETITSVKEENGIKYVESFVEFNDDWEEAISFLGYEIQSDDVLVWKYEVDADSLELIKLTNYLQSADGERTLLYERKRVFEYEKYQPDNDLVNTVFNEDSRTVTVIADAGTENEQVYTKTFGKGVEIGIMIPDEFEQCYYADSACTQLLTDVGDDNSDSTIYLKRLNETDLDNLYYANVYCDGELIFKNNLSYDDNDVEDSAYSHSEYPFYADFYLVPATYTIDICDESGNVLATRNWTFSNESEKDITKLRIAFNSTTYDIITLDSDVNVDIDTVFKVIITDSNGNEVANDYLSWADTDEKYFKLTVKDLKPDKYHISLLMLGKEDYSEIMAEDWEFISENPDDTQSISVTYKLRSGELIIEELDPEPYANYTVIVEDAQTGEIVLTQQMIPDDTHYDTFYSIIEGLKNGSYKISVANFGEIVATENWNCTTHDKDSLEKIKVLYYAATNEIEINDLGTTVTEPDNTDATSSTEKQPTSNATDNTAVASSGGTVQTGYAPVAAIMLVIMLSAAAISYFARRRQV